MNTLQHIEHIKKLKNAASREATGLQRKLFLDNVGQMASVSPNEPLLVLPLIDVNAVFIADGTYCDPQIAESLKFTLSRAIANKQSEDVIQDIQEDIRIHSLSRSLEGQNGWNDKATAGTVPGSAPTNRFIGDMRLACGITLIVGPAALGKTPLAHAIAGYGSAEYEMIRFGEPLAGYITNPVQAAHALGNAMLTSDTIVFDSFKDLLSSATGGAMRSGITRSVLPLFSTLSTIAADAGCTILVPVNPSSNDDEILELLVEAVKSNSTSIVYAQTATSWTYLVRGGEGLPRSTGTITTQFNKEGVMDINVVKSTLQSGASEPSSTHYESTYELADDELAAMILRSIRST